MFAPIISALVTIFSSLFALISSGFAWFVARITSKVFIFTTQLAVTIILMAAHAVLMAFFLYAILFLYNRYNDMIGLIRDMGTNSDILYIAFQVLQSLGVINAFHDVFAIFSPFIISYLVYRAGRVIYSSWVATSNELFKLGVLSQQ
ncbi:MAG: hypothetical protein WC656_11830 [Sulfurimonas sp.]|jgi:hypothetical protein